MHKILKKYALSIAATMSVAVFFTVYFSHNGDEKIDVIQKKESDPFTFVRSMEGTTTDGKIAQNATGELLVNTELRLMFDYYLAATGEKSLKEIVAEIEKELDNKLSSGAAIEAKNLLLRYIRYKEALAEIEKKSAHLFGNVTTAIRQRLLNMQETRKLFFNAKESSAMFGFDDAYDMDAISRLEISQNATLSEAQKRDGIKALDAAMSPALREAKEAPYQVVRLEEYARELRARGASEDEVYRMRAAATTPESAARLAEVDREESQWKSRIASYLNEKNQISNTSTAVKEEQRLLLLQQIRDQRFTQDEQKRLPAYE